MHEDLGEMKSFHTMLPPHGCRVLKLSEGVSMNLAAFYHSGMYPEIYAPDRFHLRFSFRAASGDIETCTLVYFS